MFYACVLPTERHLCLLPLDLIAKKNVKSRGGNPVRGTLFFRNLTQESVPLTVIITFCVIKLYGAMGL